MRRLAAVLRPGPLRGTRIDFLLEVLATARGARFVCVLRSIMCEDVNVLVCV